MSSLEPFLELRSLKSTFVCGDDANEKHVLAVEDAILVEIYQLLIELMDDEGYAFASKSMLFQ